MSSSSCAERIPAIVDLTRSQHISRLTERGAEIRRGQCCYKLTPDGETLRQVLLRRRVSEIVHMLTCTANRQHQCHDEGCKCECKLRGQTGIDSQHLGLLYHSEYFEA